MRYILLALLLTGCLSNNDNDTPVCNEVKKTEGYCYTPFPGNKGSKTCGLSRTSCNSIAEIGASREGYVTGVCDEEYHWAEECY